MTKACIHCATQIADAATVCVTCKRSQRRWMSWLVNLGAISTGATLLASLVLYLFSTGPQVLREWFGHDVAVVSLNFHEGPMSSPRLVVQNTTDRDVYVARLDFAYPDFDDPRRTRSLLLDMTVAGGKTATRAPNWDGDNAPDVSYAVPHVRGVPEGWNLRDEEVQRLLAATDCLSLDIEAPPEVAFGHFGDFLERREGQRMIRAKVAVRLHYFSAAKERWRSLDVPNVAILRRKDTQLCTGVIDGLDVPEVRE